jgi:putative transcriptional regulator
MSKEIFHQISEGLTEALAVARQEAEPHKLHVPPVLDVKAIRTKTGMTQRDFAAAFGFGLDQLKQWEQGRVKPVQALRAYLMLIEDNPNGMLDALKRVHA